MIKRLLLSTFVSLISFLNFAQLGCKVEITIDNYDGDELYIGYNLMGKTYVKDTLSVVNGKFILEEDTLIERGMYMAVYPETMNYFEFIMGTDQKFRLNTTFDNEVHRMVITGSEENEVLYEFFQKTDLLAVKVSELDSEAKNLAETTTSYAENREEHKKTTEEMESFKRKLIKAYPKLIASKLIRVSLDVDMPESLSKENADEEARFKYYRKHYFDCLDFSEEAFIRTNVMNARIDTYLSRLTLNQPDSIMAAVDRVCDLARANKKVFRSVVVYLLNVYANSNLIGMDAVYVHMVEKYYLSGEADWIDDENLARLKTRMEIVKPTLIGTKAAKISGINSKGKKMELNPSDGTKTIVLFWNYSDANSIAVAEDFQAMIKVLEDEMVHLVSVCTVGSEENWKESLASAGLESSAHVHYLLDDNLAYYARYFDYNGTTIKTYLLDQKGIIELKLFNGEQIFKYLGGTN